MGKLTHEGKMAKSEADYKRIMERIVDLEIKQNEIEKSYYKRFSEVLSWEKMFKVKCAIQEFGMEALNRFYPRNSHRRNEK
jgi:predicted transcriptional regulator